MTALVTYGWLGQGARGGDGEKQTDGAVLLILICIGHVIAFRQN